MDYLFTPWRYAYISTAAKTPGCLFCEKVRETDDRHALILHRAEHCFIMLNAFPYTSGHVMIAPYEHVNQLDKLSHPAAVEMILLAQRMESVLRSAYKPDGINLGMNIGACAGAGVSGHIHLHVLPRWPGDANFMTTVGETRVLPEGLSDTFARLRHGW